MYKVLLNGRDPNWCISYNEIRFGYHVKHRLIINIQLDSGDQMSWFIYCFLVIYWMHIKWVMSYPDLLHSNFGIIFYFPVCASMRLFQCNFLVKNSRHVKAWHFNLPRVFGARNSWSKTTALHRKYVGHLETGKFVQRIPCLNDQLYTTSFQHFIEHTCSFYNLWNLCFNHEYLFCSC